MLDHTDHIRDWMTPFPFTTRRHVPLLGAYEIMSRRGIRRLPVVDEHGALRGIITCSDIERVTPFAEDRDARVDALFALAGITVGEIMTADPITVAPDQPIEEAARCMYRAKVSGLPVVEADRVVGIITESDIFRLVVGGWAALKGNA